MNEKKKTNRKKLLKSIVPLELSQHVWYFLKVNKIFLIILLNCVLALPHQKFIKMYANLVNIISELFSPKMYRLRIILVVQICTCYVWFMFALRSIEVGVLNF